MPATVTRVRSILAATLLLGPYQLSWAALAALGHDFHHMSLHDAQGGLVILLHHHPISADDSADPANEDASHDDHVVRGLDASMAAAPRMPDGATPALGLPGSPVSIVAHGDRCVRMVARLEIGPAPPPVTIVLRI